MMKQIYFLLLFIISFSTYGQHKKLDARQYLDSIWSSWENEKQLDTLRLDALGEYVWLVHVFVHPDSAIHYGNVEYDYATRIKSKKHIAHAHKVLGTSLWVKGNYLESLDHFEKQLVLEKELGNQEGIAGTLNKFGIVYSDMGDGIKALRYLQESLRIREEIGEDRKTFFTLNTLGDLYYDQGNTAKAIEYFKRCIEINESNVLTLNNIGKAYLKQEDNDLALQYFNKSLKLTQSSKISRNKALSLGYIGEIHKRKGNYSLALDFLNRGLALREKLGSLPLITESLINIGNTYFEQKAYSKSIEVCERGYKMLSKLNSIEQKKNACDCLYQGYKAIGNKERALAFHEKVSVLNDSLKKDETGKKLQQMEFAKTMRLDSIVKAKEASITKEKLKTQESEISLLNTKNRVKSQWIIFGSLAAILIMALLYYRYKQRVKYKDLQNKLLNSEIEFKKKDLTNFAVNISNNQEWALSLAERMEGLKTSTGRKRAKELEELDAEIKNKIWVDKSADDFYTKIDALSSSFYDRLTTQFEGLTKTEIRLCSLIKLDLDTKQIAALQNINPSSVKMSRNRLRKKLNLSPEDDLNAFLRTF